MQDFPPSARGSSSSADALREHPLWKSAAEKRNPVMEDRRKNKRNTEEDTESKTRYERISLLAVEIQQAANPDGADSALLSSDDDMSEFDGFQDKRYADDEEESIEEEDRRSEMCEDTPRPKKRSVKTEDVIGAAAFGANPNLEGLYTDDDMCSESSEKHKKKAFKDAFPVRGVTCVGCALAHRIGPVERFVSSNIGRMSETALWKLAALTWKNDVLKPAQSEGVEIVPWNWREISAHFKLHTTNPVIGRTAIIQSLTAMRCQVEGCLVRVENGERTLDKTNADLFLKIVAADSRERQLLAAASGPVAGRGRGKPLVVDEQ